MKQASPDSGFALVAALCWSMLLALAAGAIVTISKTQADDVSSELKAAQLTAIADAGIRLTILALTSPQGEGRPDPKGTPFTVRFAETDVAMSVSDEEGKVDLNAAPYPLLARLFGAVGLAPDAAAAQANRVLDWRERGSLKRLNGAKQDDYRQLGYSYGPRQAPLQSVGEARLVLGVDESLFAQIEPSLTITSQQSELDWSVAGSAISRMRLPTSGAAELSPEQGLAPTPHIPARVFGHAFLVRAEAKVGDYAVVRTAAIRLSGDARDPVSVYYWR